MKKEIRDILIKGKREVFSKTLYDDIGYGEDKLMVFDFDFLNFCNKYPQLKKLRGLYEILLLWEDFNKRFD